ncbi:hypothetical protein ACFCYX_39850 [Streptomyces populi]|uniref:hypothetical protein n=1 Tax=Streptomyces populi TaxID=2058924 RepID=UPI0013A6A608|nr:hypothetical protein [Streptomyces populi]
MEQIGSRYTSRRAWNAASFFVAQMTAETPKQMARHADGFNTHMRALCERET